MVPVEEIIPNPRNPNKHPKKQIELLAKIIKAQGWRAPITVSNRSGFIVRGHARLEAAKLLGLTECPVDFQDYENEAVEWMGTDSLATVFLSAICLRGDESDSDNIVKLALAPKYWAASRFRKLATLEQLFDAAKLFKGYDWDTLPTRYLHSYSSRESVAKLSQFHACSFTDKE